jgi:hypothetical protein
MASFSERMGIISVRESLQIDSMDEDLRNSLWNSFAHIYWTRETDFVRLPKLTNLRHLTFALWRNFYKIPTDELDSFRWEAVRKALYQTFLQCPWNRAYDFIEFVASNGLNPALNQRFIADCNEVLQREDSAYRFVGTSITPITSEQEIAAVEQAFAISESSKPLHPVATHLNQALAFLADKQSPDLRNSMKESISAVEALCKLIAGDDKATLGKALSQIESKQVVPLHPQIKAAFQSQYGYTSDAGGIRHALKDEPNVELEDAIYMVVTCSAFVNYLVEKARKAGISL